MAAFWKETFMDKIRNYWLRHVVKIQYYASGTWYDAMITSKEVEGNTLKVVCQTQDSATLTITAVRIIDSDGEVAGQSSENIVKNSTQGVISLWEFPLYEIV